MFLLRLVEASEAGPVGEAVAFWEDRYRLKQLDLARHGNVQLLWFLVVSDVVMLSLNSLSPLVDVAQLLGREGGE